MGFWNLIISIRETLNTEVFEVGISNGFGIQKVGLWASPTIQISDQYIRKQDGVHLSSIQMVRLSGIQMPFQNQTIWNPTSSWPFQYQTSLVFISQLYFVSSSCLILTTPDFQPFCAQLKNVAQHGNMKHVKSVVWRPFGTALSSPLNQVWIPSTRNSSLHWLVLSFLHAFLYKEVYYRWSNRLPPPPPPTFILLSAQTVITNDPSSLTLVFIDGVLLLYLPLKNMSIFTQ